MLAFNLWVIVMTPRLAIAAMPLFLLAFTASAQAGNPAVAGNTTPRTVDQLAHAVSPQESALLNTVCLKVMKLLRAGPEFAGCVSSLSWSLSDQANRNLAQAIYEDCSKNGLKSETPAFAGCVLDRQHNIHAEEHKSQDSTQTARNSATLVNVNVGPPDDFWLEHAHVSYGLRTQREQDSCAALGLSPLSGSFVNCVSDLDRTMFNIDHPPG
jgi:hypothetical protein